MKQVNESNAMFHGEHDDEAYEREIRKLQRSIGIYKMLQLIVFLAQAAQTGYQVHIHNYGVATFNAFVSLFLLAVVIKQLLI